MTTDRAGELAAEPLRFDSASEAVTRDIAAALAQVLEADDLVALSGPLGAGKTVFVRALCEALEVPPEAGVSSPSYALVNHYAGGRFPVAHLDLYRLADADELEALGFRDLLAGEALICVEWPEHAAELAELATVWVRLRDLGPEARAVEISGLDAARGARLARLAPAGAAR